MATSALRVVIPTIFVLILLMIGVSIYRGGGDEKDKDENKQNRNRTLEAYSVQNGSDVPVATEKEDVENINQALKAIRDRLAQYGDIIDEDEFMGAIVRECDISPDEDGNCGELYDKNPATGCCVPKNPEMLSDEELADLADRMGQDATFSCLEGVEPDDTGSCGNNARFDYEQECCVRSCVVYPSIESSGEPVCDNPVYPNLMDGCCDISSKEAENRAKEEKRQKKELMLQTASMILGDQVITNLIPRMAQIILNYTDSTGKGKAAKAARDVAKTRATSAADARGLTGQTKTRFINWEMERTFNKAMSKDTQYINEFSRTVNKVRADQVSGNTASRKLFTKGLAKASFKFAGKVASKLAIILLRMLVKLNSGPLGWAMMVFDIFSLMLDLGDANNTATYLEQEDMFALRNKLMYEMYFTMKKDGLDYPMMYPINFAFPEEHDLAQNALTIRLADDTMKRVVNDPIFDLVEQRRVEGVELTTGESERYEQVVKTVNLFCKFILLGMSQHGAADAEGSDFKDIDLFSLSDEENLTIDLETFNTFEASTFEYIQFYFTRMVQELNHKPNPIDKYPGSAGGKATSDDDVEEAILNGKSFCGNIDLDADGVGLKPTNDMIKLVPGMVNLDYNHYKHANMGISLTAKGVAYINRPEQKYTWYKFNSVFIDPYAEDSQNNNMWLPHGTDDNSAEYAKYSGTYAASYGTEALTIDPNEFTVGDDGEITRPDPDSQGYPPIKYLTQKKRSKPEEDLDVNVAWISPLVPLIAMCEGPRGMQNEVGFKPMRRPCNISNTVLNINTGICMFTEKLCENYLRPDVKDKKDEATDTWYKDCGVSPTQNALSYVLGEQIAGRWAMQAANVSEASDAFADNPNFDTFGDAFLQTVGFWPLMASSMVEDTHEYNKDTSSSPTEAAVRTATDPFGLQMFFKTMGAKFKGKPRFCIPENMLYLGSPADECKLFRVRNSADFTTNLTIHFMLRVAIFRHNPETGEEDPYPTHSTNFQNEIKHNEDYEFFIPAARPAAEVNGVQIPAVPAGYVVISLSEDTFTDTLGPIVENTSSNCTKSVVITYDEIIPGKEYGVRAPDGCIQFGDRSETQKTIDKIFSDGYDEFADAKECVEDAIYTGALPWLETAGNEAWGESRDAWNRGLGAATDYAKNSGLAYQIVGEEVKTLFDNPKDSQIVDFFGDIGDDLEDTFTGENGGILDLFNPGNWKSPF